MKGESLKRQFLKLKEELKNGGMFIVVKLQPTRQYIENLGDGIVHTSIPGKNWELVISDSMGECDSNCKECKLCGLADSTIHKFVSCDEIWQLDID